MSASEHYSFLFFPAGLACQPDPPPPTRVSLISEIPCSSQKMDQKKLTHSLVLACKRRNNRRHTKGGVLFLQEGGATTESTTKKRVLFLHIEMRRNRRRAGRQKKKMSRVLFLQKGGEEGRFNCRFVSLLAPPQLVIEPSASSWSLLPTPSMTTGGPAWRTSTCPFSRTTTG